MPHIRDQSQRQRITTKGDARASAILDAAEAQLATGGFESITVASLTKAVGLTRAGFYFYFANKAEVIATLVARTVAALHDNIESLTPEDNATPVELVLDLLERTKQMWVEHGPVMRAAVDYSPTVPEVDASWRSAANAVTETTADILSRAGIPAGPGADNAAAMARALVWMTERSFYQASLDGSVDFQDAALTAAAIWMRVIEG